MAGTPKTAAGPPEPDIVTQLQDQLALICSRFFNFIGALQRDAPPAPLHGEAVQDQRHQALEVRKKYFFLHQFIPRQSIQPTTILFAGSNCSYAERDNREFNVAKIPHSAASSHQ